MLSLKIGSGFAWIGANDLETEGVFRFVDAEGTLNFFNWDEIHGSYAGNVHPNDRDCIRLRLSTAASMCDYECSDTGNMVPLCEADPM